MFVGILPMKRARGMTRIVLYTVTAGDRDIPVGPSATAAAAGSLR